MKRTILLMLILFVLNACEEDMIENQVLVENVSSTNLLNNPTLYEPINVSIVVDKTDAVVDAINVYLDDELILSRTNATRFNFSFDPELYEPGEAVVKIEVIQPEGNTITQEYPIAIHRKLLDVRLDNNFFRTDYQDFFLFASAADGSLLATELIETLPATITLTTDKNIGRDTPYYLNMASRFVTNDIEIVTLKTIDDLSISSLDKFTPKSPRRLGIRQQWNLPTSGFNQDILIIGRNSPDYAYGYDHVDFDFSFIKWENFNGIPVAEDYYIRSSHRDGSEQKYKWITEEDLNNGIILDVADFISENLVEGEVDVTYVDGFENGHDRRLGIYGYLSDEDFSNGTAHNIWLSGFHTLQAPDMFIRPTEDYVVNTTFHSYAHFLFLEDYLTVRRGTPLTNYPIPDWQLDFGITGKEITFNAVGNGHYVGKFSVSSGNVTDELPIVEGKKVLYHWDICFNSTTKESLTLPEFPDAMKNWSFGKFYESNTPKIEWGRVERYDGILDYEQYLNAIIKENNDPLQISPIFEAKFKSNEEFSSFYFEMINFFN
ncbi:hypothetical protein [Flagellimonas myxillae]|uniref:hypothetical protein n=1 Tax=Flagellimonas myxillae TaxID=2942214 RepID=UPI00201EBCAB|nr:hypothetical protein [Muricauda myxillae]MCL6267497.1 hypothetical protein [Muricauda myxillae]